MHPDVAVGALRRRSRRRTRSSREDPVRQGRLGGGAPGSEGGSEGRRAAQGARRARRPGAADRERAAGLPDDRSVAALADLLPTLSRWNGELLSSTADALLGLGARDGVTAVVQRLKSAPVNDTGGKYGGGPDTTGKTLRDLLAEAAPKKGTEPVPAWDDKEPPDWERWLAKNQKHFPAKLGKYGIEQLRKARG